jgi:sugar (pentulose or hexulose) kinase
MPITAGIDIGTGAVKTVLFQVDGDQNQWLAKRVDRIRQRDPFELAERAYYELCEEAGIAPTRWTTSPPPARARTSRSTPGTSTP